MCLRHVERTTSSDTNKEHGFFPVLDEIHARKGIISVVDLLCDKQECFFRVEGDWQIVTQKRSIGQTCGYSGCLTGRCRLVGVVPDSKKHTKSRYILNGESVA